MPKSSAAPTPRRAKSSKSVSDSPDLRPVKTSKQALFIFVEGLRELSEMIRPHLEAAGWSWTELAGRADVVSPTVMDALVHHKRWPSLLFFVKIAAALEELPGMPRLTPGQLVDIVVGKNWRAARTLEEFPVYEPMPDSEKFLRMWDQMPVAQRLQIAPELLERISADMKVGSELIRPETRLAELLDRAFEGYRVDAPGITKKCQAYEPSITEGQIRSILKFKDPHHNGSLDSIPLRALVGIGQCIRDPDGAAGHEAAPANTVMVLELAGRTSIQKVLTEFMEDRQLTTAEELLDWASKSDGFKFSVKERELALTALEVALLENKLPSQNTPAYEVLVLMGAELGIADKEEFMRLLAKGSVVE
jgi:hypothetical protein